MSVLKLFSKSNYYLTLICCIVFFIMVLLGILARYILKTPILFATEISRIFFVWACFFGSALALEQNSHITITFLTDWSKIPQKHIHALANFAIMIFLAAIFYSSIMVIYRLWSTYLPITGWTQSVFYLPLPFISISGLIYLIHAIFSQSKTLEL
ncbi:TRAP transporter small permease subunit [Cyclobacteriaceae bacterium YHN15]|jgi:TRAP-type transport system small permease protein|nr:TRAP transporter small permease subunit [Cyclobacteriaceae bacterium YHN15]